MTGNDNVTNCVMEKSLISPGSVLRLKICLCTNKFKYPNVVIVCYTGVLRPESVLLVPEIQIYFLKFVLHMTILKGHKTI